MINKNCLVRFSWFQLETFTGNFQLETFKHTPNRKTTTLFDTPEYVPHQMRIPEPLLGRLANVDESLDVNFVSLFGPLTYSKLC